MSNTEERHTPFLKWAGGKRWLVDNHFDLLSTDCERYIEPFLGSGAVFFRIKPENAILSDKNPNLINAYRAIRDEWWIVERYIKEHHRNHSTKYYYKIRSQKCRSSASKAAQFIYLNRTCWNGLYRVNKNGWFNVPIGTKTNVVLDSDDFEKTALLLSNVTLLDGDFSVPLKQAGEGDFVFVDPPYTVKHNNNGFVKYNESLFSWDDQIRLRDNVRDAIDRGAKVLITNAYHDCIKKLYRGIGKKKKLTRNSVISGSVKARGNYDEMVIKCY